MDRRLSVFAFCCLILIALATAPAQAVIDPGERQFTFCAYVCSPTGGGGDACTSCNLAGTPSTCGQYWGRPANDLDGDGIINTSDNCQCAANANQANCDGDADGDVCDYQDNSWTRISVGTQRCYLDEDNHVYSTTLEFYYQDVYRSACTGQSCYKKYLYGSVSCSLGSDNYQCCLNKWFYTDCQGAWNQDNCGLPRCAF